MKTLKRSLQLSLWVCAHGTNINYHSVQADPLCMHADPAAENFNYPVSFDVRELITLEDVMEEMQLGPNG